MLHADPEQASVRKDTTHQLTFVVADPAERLIEGLNIDAVVTSWPNTGRYIGECRSDINGECRVAYQSALTGTDVVRTWIDVNDNDVADEATTTEAGARGGWRRTRPGRCGGHLDCNRTFPHPFARDDPFARHNSDARR